MKRWIRLGAIVVAIAAMVVAIVLLRSQDPDAATDEPTPRLGDDPERVTLFENDRGAIERITIDGADSDLTIERVSDEEFRPVYEYDVEFERQRVNRIVSQAVSLTSRRVIGEVDDPSEYGFDEPAATITVESSDGEQQRITVGSMTPARDAYYVMRPDDENVYSVFNSWIRPFFTTLDSMRVRSIPQIDFQALERIVIETLEGRTIRTELVPEWDEDPELGFSRFAVYEPFSRRFQANTNWFEELQGGLENLQIGTFVDDAPDDLSEYGLAPPEARVVIEDQETTFEVLVGASTEGGRFATFPDTPSVFVLSGIEPLVDVEPYDTISPFALIVNIDLIDTFVVETGEQTFTGRIERTPADDPETEEEEFDEAYFLNGEQIDEDTFKDLYQWAIGLQLDAEIDAANIPTTDELAAREPIVSITYNLNNEMEPLNVSFVPENENFAAVVREGRAEFLIARAKLDRLVRAFERAAGEL
ncbi:MAG: DUF4340 domain-containing protein [Spirochaetota bacterium]